jgi:23S rRNA pseudouridine2605 synthase
VQIDPRADKISIFTKDGYKYPTKDSLKLWVYYKPVKVICTRDDPGRRVTIFDFLLNHPDLKDNHFMSVGRLDYTSDGLLLLTNDGDLKRALELPKNEIQRDYRVRVYGRFTDEKLEKIRKGAVISGEQYGPFWCNVRRYQTRNTWLSISMWQGKNREIRKIMQKNSLRVNRLKRVRYGPYTLEDVDLPS